MSQSSSLLCTSTAPQRCAMAEEFELNALTPLDGRYASRVAPVRAYFSEAALIKYRVRVEVEYLVALSGAVPALKDVFAGGNLAKWRGGAGPGGGGPPPPGAGRRLWQNAGLELCDFVVLDFGEFQKMAISKNKIGRAHV